MAPLLPTFLTLSLSLPLLTLAHANQPTPALHLFNRQASSASSAAATATTTRRNTSHGSATVNSAAITNIGTATSAAPTVPLPSTFAPGATSPVKGAPALPNAAALLPASYPTLDRTPPLDSAEMREWLSKIDLSKVPNIPVTQAGGCANASNAQALANAATNCWWTCGGCTRSTDVTFCPEKNTWGTSYDDGPSPYTPQLLTFLDQHNLKTTFFIVGSRAISRPEMVQYEYMTGHQLSVHTWSHPALTTMTNEQIVAELGWTVKVIKDITGVSPNTFRPPYGDIDDRVRNIAAQMGLTPIIWTSYNGATFDTQDWEISAGVVTTQQVVNNFNRIIGNTSSLPTGFIVLQHDLYQQAVDLAINFVLPQAIQRPELSLKTIVECLNKNLEDAYVETATDLARVVVGASGTGSVPGVTISTVASGKASSTPTGDARPTGSGSGAAEGFVKVSLGALVAAMVMGGAALVM